MAHLVQWVPPNWFQPLVTLPGPGGVGKARLALRVAHDLHGLFGDGVAFVPLAPITDSDLALATIVQALGVRERSDRTACGMGERQQSISQLIRITPTVRDRPATPGEEVVMSGHGGWHHASIVADLMLNVMGFLSGVGVGHALLSPNVAERPVPRVQTTVPVESFPALQEARGRPSVEAPPTRAASASVTAPLMRPYPLLPQTSNTAALATSRDWRVALQLIATWQRPTNHPADAQDAHRFPVVALMVAPRGTPRGDAPDS